MGPNFNLFRVRHPSRALKPSQLKMNSKGCSRTFLRPYREAVLWIWVPVHCAKIAIFLDKMLGVHWKWNVGVERDSKSLLFNKYFSIFSRFRQRYKSLFKGRKPGLFVISISMLPDPHSHYGSGSRIAKWTRIRIHINESILVVYLSTVV